MSLIIFVYRCKNCWERSFILVEIINKKTSIDFLLSYNFIHKILIDLNKMFVNSDSKEVNRVNDKTDGICPSSLDSKCTL